MKRNPDFVMRLSLLISDLLAVTASFGLAYYYRTHFDTRPYLLGSDTASFVLSIASLLPLWVILLSISGVYDKSIYLYRPKVYLRLLVVAAIGTMGLITFSYFTESSLFPARLIAVYSFLLCFLLLVMVRELVTLLRKILLRRGIGLVNVVITGDSDVTTLILHYMLDNPGSGYKVVGVVASDVFVPHSLRHRFASIDEALTIAKPDVIMQTDTKNSGRVYELAVDSHCEYRYIPSHQALANTKHRTEIIGTFPVIVVQTTPLIGYGRTIKRAFDLLASVLMIIVFSPVMLLVALAIKLGDPKGPVFMQGKMATRITRFNRLFRLYKFRSHYARFDGKPDEEVFAMIGRPELLTQYRQNGDKLEGRDFRVTPVGRFIRRFSLDELPQLFNVVKGDLSLVGPRALVPHELSKFKRWHAIISVKSGLTGLAVVSGRRNISFEERRSLDVYYVQNWTFWLDISILLRTVRVIFANQSDD